MVEFCDYALWKMSIRGISRDEVELVLTDPHDDFPSRNREHPRHCYVREIDERPIQVVVEAADHNLVVTAYDKSQERCLCP